MLFRSLERCKTKPVAFAVRTNIEYIPSPDDLCPISKAAIAFQPKEFLHIKDVGITIHTKKSRSIINVFFRFQIFRNLIMIGGLVE